MELVIVSTITEQCYSNSDGEKIFNVLYPKLKDGKRVEVSFEGFDSVTSSFVNSALIELLEVFEFDIIKNGLKFSNTTRQINHLINQRFGFEIKKRKKLISNI